MQTNITNTYMLKSLRRVIKTNYKAIAGLFLLTTAAGIIGYFAPGTRDPIDFINSVYSHSGNSAVSVIYLSAGILALKATKKTGRLWSVWRYVAYTFLLFAASSVGATIFSLVHIQNAFTESMPYVLYVISAIFFLLGTRKMLNAMGYAPKLLTSYGIILFYAALSIITGTIFFTTGETIIKNMYGWLLVFYPVAGYAVATCYMAYYFRKLTGFIGKSFRFLSYSVAFLTLLSFQDVAAIAFRVYDYQAGIEIKSTEAIA